MSQPKTIRRDRSQSQPSSQTASPSQHVSYLNDDVLTFVTIPKEFSVATTDTATATTVPDVNPLLPLLEAAITGCVYDLAVVVHELYKDKYVCAKVKTRQWFVFSGHHWSYSEIGPYHDISTHLVKVFEKLLNEEKINYPDRPNPVRIGALQALISKLKNVHFKETLIKECSYIFYQPGFCAKLDRTQGLVCFTNGVLDINERIFRDGRIDDMLSLYIDAAYPASDTPRRIHEFIAFRNEILSKRTADNSRTSRMSTQANAIDTLFGGGV